MVVADLRAPPARPVRADRRPLALLAAGAALGVGLALLGLLGAAGGADAIPAGAVARVGDALIADDDYRRALAALAADRRTALDAGERARVLARLVDEELLVQRALALGLARDDRVVRAGLVDAVIAAVTAAARDADPTADGLARFYAEERAFFVRPGRLRVERVRIRGGDAARAAEARRRLAAGEPAAAVREELGEPEIAPVPDTLLPPAKLREYLGPTALTAVAALAPGEVAAPVRTMAGLDVVRLVARAAPEVPPLAAIADVVRAEYRRRAAEEALAAYLADLRAAAEVRTRSP